MAWCRHRPRSRTSLLLPPHSVRDACFPLARTQIEITDTAVIGDLAAARATIDILRAKGVRILLDDFGTGYRA
jgi:predicted signal transduction protein with EAL and GGDEF domain